MRRVFLLPGFLVLAAYGVDVVEWCATVYSPDLIDRRPASHSLLPVGLLVLGACIVFGALFRARRPWAYVLVAAVVVSHLFLDHPTVRAVVAELHTNRSVEDSLPDLSVSVLAETRVYGLLFILVLLAQGSLERGCPRPAKTASAVLAVGCIASLGVPYLAVWSPVYLLSLIHGGGMLRRHLAPTLLWNLVPLVPVCALWVTTAMMSNRLQTARALVSKGSYYDAMLVYQSALRLPSRDGRVSIHVGMGVCYERLADWAEAERSYVKARTFREHGAWLDLLLARLYHRCDDPALCRPDEAVRLYEQVIDRKDAPQHIKVLAQRELKTLLERTGVP